MNAFGKCKRRVGGLVLAQNVAFTLISWNYYCHENNWLGLVYGMLLLRVHAVHGTFIVELRYHLRVYDVVFGYADASRYVQLFLCFL